MSDNTGKAGAKFDGFQVGPIRLPTADTIIARTNWVSNGGPPQMITRGFAYPQKATHMRLKGATLRGRAVGVPADIMLEEALPDLIRVIEEESGHSACKIRSAWDRQADMYSIVVHCPGCDRMWRHNTSGQVLGLMRRQASDTAAMADMWFHQEIVPFFMNIVAEECFGLRELQKMAEYITKRLVHHGEAGMPYAQLVHEIIQDALAPAGDVSEHLRRMNFDAAWEAVPGTDWRLPILRLPEGHPLRTW